MFKLSLCVQKYNDNSVFSVPSVYMGIAYASYILLVSTLQSGYATEL